MLPAEHLSRIHRKSGIFGPDDDTLLHKPMMLYCGAENRCGESMADGDVSAIKATSKHDQATRISLKCDSFALAAAMAI